MQCAISDLSMVEKGDIPNAAESFCFLVRGIAGLGISMSSARFRFLF